MKKILMVMTFLSTAISSLTAQETNISSNVSFEEPNFQKIASTYLYGYLGYHREEYESVLSENLSATIIRDGELLLSGGKSDLLHFMDQRYFGVTYKCSNIKTKIFSSDGQPCIKVSSLQYISPETIGLIKDTITFTVAEENGSLKITSLTHHFFLQIVE